MTTKDRTPLNINHLVIIGTGLIGGSAALALKRAGCVKRVTGVGRSQPNLEDAIRLGVIDDYSHDTQAAVADADMVIIAVPVAACNQVFKDLATSLPPHAIMTDAGSTKQSVIHAAEQHLPTLANFVPAHPIAGTEHSGAAAAFAELFEQRMCILTPHPQTHAHALQQVTALWQTVGADIEVMSAAAHDDIFASVSHLPHLAAFSIVNAVCAQNSLDPFRFAASGFRDFTRIASSSPDMWRDISLCNPQAIIDKIDALQTELHTLRQALMDRDGDLLLQKFKAAKKARDQWLANYGEKE